MKYGPNTRTAKKAIEAGALIDLNPPTPEDMAFLCRQLVQATLPHADPGNVMVWSRTNGDLSLVIQQGVRRDGTPVGYPFGTIPRLLLYWMTREALRNNSTHIALGDSLGGFMRELGLDPRSGGAKSDRARLERQMDRLFSAHISFDGSVITEDMSAVVTENVHVVRRRVLWWDRKAHPDQPSLWESYIELNTDFFNAIKASPVPLDVRHLRALQRSPLALDLYNLMAYNAYRASRSGKAAYMTWRQLQSALGTNYAEIDDLRKTIKATMRKILAAYSGLRLGSREGGIEVLPSSRPAIPPAL